MKTLLRAHERKRISVYVTEARPRGLGFVVRFSTAWLGSDCCSHLMQYQNIRSLSSRWHPMHSRTGFRRSLRHG